MQLVKSSSSILRKFLIFNSLIFLILGLFTFFYLKAIQPNLVEQRVEKHTVIINNTSNHIERLNIKKAIKEINIPHLHIHGSSDSTVLIEDALEMKRWNNKINLVIINDADHVFGSSHPYNKNKFPIHLNKALLKTLEFLKS